MQILEGASDRSNTITLFLFILIERQIQPKIWKSKKASFFEMCQIQKKVQES